MAGFGWFGSLRSPRLLYALLSGVELVSAKEYSGQVEPHRRIDHTSQGNSLTDGTLVFNAKRSERESG